MTSLFITRAQHDRLLTDNTELLRLAFHRCMRRTYHVEGVRFYGLPAGISSKLTSALNAMSDQPTVTITISVAQRDALLPRHRALLDLAAFESHRGEKRGMVPFEGGYLLQNISLPVADRIQKILASFAK